MANKKANPQREDMIDKRLDNWKSTCIDSDAEPLLLISMTSDGEGLMQSKIGMSDESMRSLLQEVLKQL
jgi:hypothetical protein